MDCIHYIMCIIKGKYNYSFIHPLHYYYCVIWYGKIWISGKLLSRDQDHTSLSAHFISNMKPIELEVWRTKEPPVVNRDSTKTVENLYFIFTTWQKGFNLTGEKLASLRDEFPVFWFEQAARDSFLISTFWQLRL